MGPFQKLSKIQTFVFVASMQLNVSGKRPFDGQRYAWVGPRLRERSPTSVLESTSRHRRNPLRLRFIVQYSFLSSRSVVVAAVSASLNQLPAVQTCITLQETRTESPSVPETLN